MDFEVLEFFGTGNSELGALYELVRYVLRAEFQLDSLEAVLIAMELLFCSAGAVMEEHFDVVILRKLRFS